MKRPEWFPAKPSRYNRTVHHGVWELVFLMVILKIPIVYLCGVVYYAIKAEPRPDAGAGGHRAARAGRLVRRLVHAPATRPYGRARTAGRPARIRARRVRPPSRGGAPVSA